MKDSGLKSTMIPNDTHITPLEKGIGLTHWSQVFNQLQSYVNQNQKYNLGPKNDEFKLLKYF